VILGIVLIMSNLLANQGGKDNYGYMWTDSKSPTENSIEYDWIDVKDGTSIFPDVTNNLDAYMPVSLPFNFTFYGTQYSQIWVSSNGFISFTDPGSSFPENDTIPSASAPNYIIAAYWDDLDADGNDNAYYKTIGSAPNRQFVIQWDKFKQNNSTSSSSEITFEVILYEHSNLIKIQYNYVSSASADSTNGNSATVGIKSGNDGVLYSYNQEGAITSFSAILFHPRSLGPQANASIQFR